MVTASLTLQGVIWGVGVDTRADPPAHYRVQKVGFQYPNIYPGVVRSPKPSLVRDN